MESDLVSLVRHQAPHRSGMSMTTDKFDEDGWFSRSWRHREEVVYPDLFGPLSDGIYPIPADVFTNTFRQDFDPRWLHTGVFQSSPNEKHDSWLYVSSGLSNEWWRDELDSDAESGIGNEFILEIPWQSKSAILRLLHVCAFQTLLAHDKYPGREPLLPYDRIPLRGPIFEDPSEITFLMVTPSPGLPETSQLESGVFYWNHLIGITDAEAKFARDGNGAGLRGWLVSTTFTSVISRRLHYAQ